MSLCEQFGTLKELLIMLLSVARKPNPEKGNDKRLVVYVSQEMYEELEQRAKDEDRSVSNFTRNLIALALEKGVIQE
ncbi:MAG: ribbon-helix-helix protein, CopG family [Iphinoe sp. HA4291-MV1]|jgi:hypothetical protein|nr:ribbon-helix-helix protein, CopG family [Iphinoe sp. HA4291-MV1]